MTVTGESVFIAAKSDISKKTGKEYRNVKFVDEELDEYFSFFVDESLFAECQGLTKRTPVLLTIELTVSSRFAKLLSVEVCHS